MILNEINQLLFQLSKSIFQKEHVNTHYIHLYRLPGYWISFDKSAYFLSRLVSWDNVVVLELPDCSYPVVAVYVRPEDLSDVYRQTSYIKVNDREQTLKTRLFLDGYEAWRNEEVDN